MPKCKKKKIKCFLQTFTEQELYILTIPLTIWVQVKLNVIWTLSSNEGWFFVLVSLFHSSSNVKIRLRNRNRNGVHLEFSLASKHCSFSMQRGEVFKGHLSGSEAPRWQLIPPPSSTGSTQGNNAKQTNNRKKRTELTYFSTRISVWKISSN